MCAHTCTHTCTHTMTLCTLTREGIMTRGSSLEPNHSCVSVSGLQPPQQGEIVTLCRSHASATLLQLHPQVRPGPEALWDRLGPLLSGGPSERSQWSWGSLVAKAATGQPSWEGSSVSADHTVPVTATQLCPSSGRAASPYVDGFRASVPANLLIHTLGRWNFLCFPRAARGSSFSF